MTSYVMMGSVLLLLTALLMFFFLLLLLLLFLLLPALPQSTGLLQPFPHPLLLLLSR